MQIERPSDISVSFLKYNNKKKIIKSIYQLEQVSRSELSKKLHISKPAISDNLEGLLSCGIVQEIGEGQAAAHGGRKPVLLRFNREAKYILSVDFNVSNPLFVLSDLCGNIKREFEIQVSRNTRKEDYASIIHNGLALLVNSSGIGKEKIYCVAIAAPGVFDADGKLATCNAKFGGGEWSTFDFRKEVQESFNLPTIVVNDVNAAAIGEWNSVSQREDNSMLYISCGEGIGAGLIINGRLYTGLNNCAGEIYNYTDLDRLKHGSNVEQEICIHSYIQRINQEKEARGDKSDLVTDFETVIEAYKNGDELVCKIGDEFCNELAVIVLNYVNLMAFDSVVFGGEYSFLYERFHQIFHEKYKGLCVTAPQITLSREGKYSGIYGLVSLAREHYFEEICRL